MKASVFFTNKALITIMLLAIFAQSLNAQTTYTVTSTSITGAGSFTEAIDLANANPGADIIEFTPGLQVDATVPSVGPSNSIMAHITESVVIDGKGAALNGIQTWIGAGGIVNSLSDCPGDVPGTIQLAYMPGFVAIGTAGADNSAIDVTIKNLTIKQFNQVAEIYKNASLVLENFEAYDTFSTFECLGDVMINAREGVSLTITDSKFSNAENWSIPESSASIYGSNAADLTIERSTFGDLCQREQPAIYWDGASGTEVNIVSSRIVRSGGIRISGASVSNIVNSIWVNYYIQVPRIGDLIRNNSSGDMNIIASSFEWNSNECDGLCQSNGYQNLFEIKGSGDINFSQSAVGFNWDPATGADELNTLGINGGSGSFTADVYTWIQPTTQQDADALKTITSQPALLTDLFGFNRGVNGVTGDYDVEMVTPANGGELIDVIPPGNPLINPIDNSTITLDVVGNDREDANGDRDIGALQLALAPFLAVDTTGDGFVKLAWTEPLHHDDLPIIKYEVEYDVSGGSSPTTITQTDTVQEVSGLTNGTAYKFKVRAVYDNSGTEEDGPFSNTVTESPYGAIDPPVVTATPGNAEVSLSWNQPDLKGNTFLGYIIQWGEVAPFWEGSLYIMDYNTTSTTVSGLTSGTEYVFSVIVNSIPLPSLGGTATATPFGPIAAPVVTAVPGDTKVDLSWNQPDLNGNMFFDYIIQWAEVPPFWEGSQVINDYNTLSTTVTGLTNGTSYVFSVKVFATPLEGPGGIATATPGIYYYYKSTADGGDWEGTGTWTRSLTEDGTYEATTDQPTDLNSLSVIITNSANVTVSTTGKTCRALSIEDGGVLTIEVGGSITTTGVVSTTDVDGLIIKSDATGTGSLIHGSGNPLATVERYVPMDGWHFVSPSTSGVTPQNFYIDTDNSSWLTSWDETTQAWTYFVDPLDQDLPLGSGYSYWWQSSPAREMTTPGTVEFKGNLLDPTADLTIPLSNNGSGDAPGFNLIGNPWPSSVYVGPSLVNDLTNCEASVWIWNNSANSGNGWFEWASTGTASGAPINPLEVVTDIASGQGFYLRALSGGGSVLFNGSARDHNTSATFWKESEEISDDVNPLIQLLITKNGFTDKGYIIFGENGSTGFENGFDVTKMFGGDLNTYVYLNEEDHNYAQNYLSELVESEERVVDVYVRAGSEGEHIFTVNMDYIPNTLVILEDTETGDLTKMNNDVVYTFSANPGDAENRFKLHFTSGATSIVNPELEKDNAVKIYSFDKAVYISNKDNSIYESAVVSIFDMYGREIYSTQSRLENNTRIPVNINNSYLIVRVIVGSNTYIEKVFVK